jgi:hypothetical protein
MAFKYVIAEGPAQDQVDLLLDFYNIEVEAFETFQNSNAAIQDAIQSAVGKLKKFIMQGLVEISDKEGLTIIHNLAHPKGETKQIFYGLLTGRAKVAMGRVKESENFHGKIYAMMGSMANLSAESMTSLIGVDTFVVECLGSIFLMG